MTFPQMPGSQHPVPVTPPIRKTVVQHCGYSALMGTPFDWQCPGCGTVVPAPK